MSETLFKQQTDGSIKNEKEINDLNTLSHAKACLVVEPEVRLSTTDYNSFEKDGLQALAVFEQIIQLLSKRGAKVLHAFSGSGTVLDLMSDTLEREAYGIEPNEEKVNEYESRCEQDMFMQEARPCARCKITEYRTEDKFDLIIVTPPILLPREKSSKRLADKDFNEYTEEYAGNVLHLGKMLSENGFLVTISQDFYAAKTYYNTLTRIQNLVQDELQLRGIKIFPKPIPYEKKQFLTDYVPLVNYCVVGIFSNLTN